MTTIRNSRARSCRRRSTREGSPRPSIAFAWPGDLTTRKSESPLDAGGDDQWIDVQRFILRIAFAARLVHDVFAVEEDGHAFAEADVDAGIGQELHFTLEVG